MKKLNSRVGWKYIQLPVSFHPNMIAQHPLPPRVTYKSSHWLWTCSIGGFASQNIHRGGGFSWLLRKTQLNYSTHTKKHAPWSVSQFCTDSQREESGGELGAFRITLITLLWSFRTCVLPHHHPQSSRPSSSYIISDPARTDFNFPSKLKMPFSLSLASWHVGI